MRANFKSQYILVSERNALFKLLNGESYRGETHLKMALQEPLSSLQPEFKQEGVGTFTNCLLLHRLLITGQVPEYFIFLSYLISSSPGAGGGGAKEEAGALPLPPLSHLRVHISWFKGEIPGHFEVLETKFSIYQCWSNLCLKIHDKFSRLPNILTKISSDE